METKEPLDIGGQGNIVIVRFRSVSISDAEEIARASAQLKGHLETHQPAGLIFDFTGVKFFSSQILGLLLEARTRLHPSGGRVVVVALTQQLRRVFRITNLDKIFDFYPDAPAALAQLSAPPA
jgi:anti-sigma B factor antagonist